MPLPSEESTGDGSPDDIEFKERVDSRLIHEATEYLKRQSKHLCDGNILDQKISHVLSSISLQQTQNLSPLCFQQLRQDTDAQIFVQSKQTGTTPLHSRQIFSLTAEEHKQTEQTFAFRRFRSPR